MATQARETFPILLDFPNDWATAEFVKQYLYNKRKNAVTKGYMPKRDERIKAARNANKVSTIQGRHKERLGAIRNLKARAGKENAAAGSSDSRDNGADDEEVDKEGEMNESD